MVKDRMITTVKSEGPNCACQFDEYYRKAREKPKKPTLVLVFAPDWPRKQQLPSDWLGLDDRVFQC